MKRTKEAYYRANPTFEQTQLSSGVTFVIGEDESYHNRTREYQKMQKQFLDEQCQQKRMIKDNQKLTTQLFDQQLLHNTHGRGELEMEKHKRLFEVERAHDNYNLNLANQRQEREKRQKQRQREEEQREMQLLMQRKVKRHGV